MRNTGCWFAVAGLLVGVSSVTIAWGQVQEERIRGPRGAARGASSPDRITDAVAYRLLFRAIGSWRGSTPAQRESLRSLFKDVELNDKDLEVIRLAAKEFHEQLLLDEGAAAVTESKRLGRERTSGETEELNELRRHRQRLTSELIEKLQRRLTPEGAQALAKYCREHVKSHIAVIPRAAVTATPQD